jgi:hypothetical protein
MKALKFIAAIICFFVMFLGFGILAMVEGVG